MATRAHVLGQLQRELRHAEDVREDGYAAQIRQEIARLSAGTPDSPVRETLAPRQAPARRKPARPGR